MAAFSLWVAFWVAIKAFSQYIESMANWNHGNDGTSSDAPQGGAPKL